VEVSSLVHTNHQPFQEYSTAVVVAVAASEGLAAKRMPPATSGDDGDLPSTGALDDEIEREMTPRLHFFKLLLVEETGMGRT
jgi:hypothetical protein